MKKILYLCGMMLLCLNMMAQIDPYDKNWDTIVYDDFSTPGRYWYDWSFISNDGLWRAYPGSGITHGKELMIYQYDQCRFNDSDGFMELVAEYDSKDSIPNQHYDLPSWIHEFPDSDSLFYFSGTINYVKRNRNTEEGYFRYGFFEIKCKLPIHQGAFPAFWLWHGDSIPEDPHYEEIDIFEFSWRFEDSVSSIHYSPNPHGAGNPYCFTSGIYYNDTSSYGGYEVSFARNFPMISDSLNHWHTFACEWLPEHVIWYCDGQVINEFHDATHIPHHALVLKANYSIDDYALLNYTRGNPPEWEGTDAMIIDYVKVLQLQWDCDNDVYITCQTDLDGFEYKVKKSFSITAGNGPVRVGNTNKVTFRATDSFEITGPFQVDNGGEMTVIMQSCPAFEQ